ncbi:hypothetical protein FJR08_05505 [Dolichospermum sp. UHCC 0260]|nr:hypothetical protein [Dolichospermum sp. UHCC 0299]MTJ23872.1 hypothetical protein [Dolichospermum sp. UHCC 0352]MTJ34030.1 hypothetical protein [Dolichospermum sp. UHCC 0260]MTJ39205.1 hypothetical protein [Dolichospermum sp. UHCC 0406]
MNIIVVGWVDVRKPNKTFDNVGLRCRLTQPTFLHFLNAQKGNIELEIEQLKAALDRFLP